jgi:hypothetical protein
MRLLPSALTLLTLLIAGCASTRAPQLYLSHFGLKEPEVKDFEACRSFGCRQLSQLSYSESEWQSICALFEPAPQRPAEERERLLVAVAAMETIIGEKNGTSADTPKNQRHASTGPQLDCIAEAANTTVALILLDQEGLIRHHHISYPQHRGFAHLRFPHNTAAVIENGTGDHYAIDSWFFANGVKPVCVPVSEWKAGYDPSKK